MNRQRAAAQTGCSILESAKRLGLEAFSVHGLIQRRKLHADVTFSGELEIPETEIERVLSKLSPRQDRRARKE
jgi:hypothetical protein